MATLSYTWRTFARELTLIALACLFCVPIYLLLSISLKTTSQAYTTPFSVPTHPHLSSYGTAWTQSTNPSLGQAALNSIIITLCSVAFLIVVSAPAAYVLVRRPSKLSTGLYLLFVLGYILPLQLAIIPVYTTMRNLHLTGNYVGAVLLYTGLLMPLAVFLYTGFVRTIPRDYEEAAQVDGASQMRIFLRVVFPLLRPITGTVAVMTGLVVWNDFFVSLIFLSGSKVATLPLAIYSFVGGEIQKWNIIFAGVVIAIIPMLLFFVVAQKQMIRGFAGGIRG